MDTCSMQLLERILKTATIQKYDGNVKFKEEGCWCSQKKLPHHLQLKQLKKLVLVPSSSRETKSQSKQLAVRCYLNAILYDRWIGLAINDDCVLMHWPPRFQI